MHDLASLFNHFLAKLSRFQYFYCRSPPSDPGFHFLRAANLHTEEARTIRQVFDALGMVPGALLDATDHHGRKAERHLDLALVAPDHPPRCGEELLGIEALRNAKALPGERCLVNPFDLERPNSLA